MISQKQSDFLLFKSIIELVDKGEHLNIDGLKNIISLKASLNKGLSKDIKRYFPKVIKAERSIVNVPKNINYYWIAGFFSGEGCFSINVCKAADCKTGYSVKLLVRVT